MDYLAGLPGKRDRTKAAELLRQAAGKGSREAFLGLFMISMGGPGVPAVPEEALSWIRLASETPGPNPSPGQARDLGSKLAARLPPDAVARVDARLARWRSGHPGKPAPR